MQKAGRTVLMVAITTVPSSSVSSQGSRTTSAPFFFAVCPRVRQQQCLSSPVDGAYLEHLAAVVDSHCDVLDAVAVLDQMVVVGLVAWRQRRGQNNEHLCDRIRTLGG